MVSSVQADGFPSAVEDSSSALLFDRLKWLTSKEAAFLLRTSDGQIRNLVWRGKLKSYHYGSRLRFLRSDVEALLKPSF
jgi:excisionase family DNA binding protein